MRPIICVKCVMNKRRHFLRVSSHCCSSMEYGWPGWRGSSAPAAPLPPVATIANRDHHPQKGK